MDTPDPASIDAEKKQYLNIATVESISGESTTKNSNALASARSEELSSDNVDEDEAFNQLSNELADDGATGMTGGTGATGATGGDNLGTGGTGATGATGAKQKSEEANKERSDQRCNRNDEQSG